MNGMKEAEFGWREFLRGFYALLFASLALLSVVLIAFSLRVTNALLDQALSVEGSALARASARGAFVPLALEDSERLEQWLTPFEAEARVVEVRVLDKARRVAAQKSGPAQMDGTARVFEAPVLSPRSRRPPIGFVQVTMTSRALKRRFYRQAVWGSVLALLLMAFVYIVVSRLAERLTRRLKNIIEEARTAENLRRSNADLEQFAAVASHDLKEPLRKIAIFSKSLADMKLEELRECGGDYLRRMTEAARRMEELIDDLLAYSRIGGVSGVVERVDLNAAALEAIENLQSAIDEAGAEIRVGKLPVIRAHRAAIVRLFQNLIANAIKFRGKNPPVVDIEPQRGLNRCGFAVRDNGLGIDSKYHRKIFEIFSRLHPRREFKGSGIGLAACRRVVDLHAGEIRVESEESKGASFIVLFPQ